MPQIIQSKAGIAKLYQLDRQHGNQPRYMRQDNRIWEMSEKWKRL